MCDRSDDFPELSDAQKAGWQATVSDLRDMSAGLRNGTATREDMEGALNRLLSCDINRETLINAVHVPPEAGLYAAALEQILRRIPDGGPLDQPRRGLVPDRGRLRCAARRD